VNVKKLLADSDKCTGCGICEEVCSKAYYKTADRDKSAIRVTSGDSGGFTIAVCDQCGVCKEMCTIMALKTAANGVVQLSKKICVGCLVCVGECLRDFMQYNDDLPTPFKCIACGLCAAKCPAGALRLTP
jgi:Fe-S-cluster-containing hydrogenase component 2